MSGELEVVEIDHQDRIEKESSQFQGFNPSVPDETNISYGSTSKLSIFSLKSQNTTFDEVETVGMDMANDIDIDIEKDRENEIYIENENECIHRPVTNKIINKNNQTLLSLVQDIYKGKLLPKCKSVQSIEENRNENNLFRASNRLNLPDYVKGTSSKTDSISLDLIATTVLQPKVRAIFNFSSFNKMQSRCFDWLYFSDDNCVISAPAGSGKSILLELAILRLFKDNLTLKAVYLAPTNALCIQRYKDWKLKFSTLNLSVVLVIGNVDDLGCMLKSLNIVITTPEKWNLITKLDAGCLSLLKTCNLLLVDEIQFLADPRGAILEIIITRIKLKLKSVRIIVLSSMISNTEEISCWLKLNSNSHAVANSLVFDNSYRSVRLKKIVVGFKGTHNFKFDQGLNSHLVEVLTNESYKKPTLVFCPTRSSCVSTALYLNSKMMINTPKPARYCVDLFDKDLLSLSTKGIAYHHAGLSYTDRQKIESGFLAGEVLIICCTSTLAMAGNLLAYMVVIKGTKCWTRSNFDEYNETQMLQMIGRAGISDFDTCKVVIMTELKNKQKYERLGSGVDDFESLLFDNLYEYLIAEIHLGIVSTSVEAVNWLKSTFFYQKCLKNWYYYSLRIGNMERTRNSELALALHMYSVLDKLKNFTLIEVNQSGKYICTKYGTIMCKYSIKFKTMESMMKVPRGQSLYEILNLVSTSNEFLYLTMKSHEKNLFRVINESPFTKFPIASKDINVHHKVMLLIQYELGGMEFPNFCSSAKLRPNFDRDKASVLQASSRVLGCFIEFFAEKKDAVSLINAFKLSRSIIGKLWDDSSPNLLKQLEGIEESHIKLLVANNIADLNSIKLITLPQLEKYLKVKGLISSKIYNEMQAVPDLNLTLSFCNSSLSQECGGAKIEINVVITVSNAKTASIWRNRNLILCVVSHLSNGMLIDFKKIPVSEFIDDSKKTFIICTAFTNLKLKLTSSVYAENIAGVESFATISLENFIDPPIATKVLTQESGCNIHLDTDVSNFDSFSSLISECGKSESIFGELEVKRNSGQIVHEVDNKTFWNNSFKRKEGMKDTCDQSMNGNKRRKCRKIKFPRIELPSYFDESSGDEYFKSLIQ